MTLSDEIRVARKKTLLSQETFADTIGVSVASIIRWENGKSKPSLTAMKKIKKFCETNKVEYSNIENAWLDFIAEVRDNGNS